jgi:hypothetical protein
VAFQWSQASFLIFIQGLVVCLWTASHRKIAIAANEILGNHRSQSQPGRLELGCVATVDSNGRTIFVADAHRDDGNRFVMRADEKLTAFLELESAIRAVSP